MRSALLPFLLAFGFIVSGAFTPVTAGPIHDAAKKGNIKQLTRLLKNKKGNPVNTRDKEGMTPLHHAAAGKHDKAVALLLENGAEVDARTPNGNVTPLMMAVAKGSREVARLLLDHGADINAMTDNAGGPIHVAAQMGDAALFGELLTRGADPNIQDKNEGWTPLHYAVFYKQREIIRILLADSVIVDPRAHRGYTPMHIAAEQGDAESMELLLAHRADPNSQTMAGRTPLHEAARRGRLEAAKLLLDAGADPTIKDEYNSTPLDESIQYERTAITDLLQSHASTR